MILMEMTPMYNTQYHSKMEKKKKIFKGLVSAMNIP